MLSEKDLFLDAIDLSAAERGAFLHHACLGDDALRNQVVALLQAHLQSGDILDVPVLQQLSLPGSTFRDRANVDTYSEVQMPNQYPFLKPSSISGNLGVLGAYEIIREIGRGGFGVVFEGKHTKHGRTDAIKVLTGTEKPTQRERDRFMREASAVAAIKHPNVVTLYGVEDEPVPYLTMEYIPQTLFGFLTDGNPLPLSDILRVSHEIASGLAAAHEKKIIHRDIKPKNILIDENGQVKIADFGLARFLEDVNLSGTNSGTIPYMSPEQISGQELDVKTDVFSFATVLYEMCAGQLPFDATSYPKLIQGILEGKAIPLRELNPQIPLWLSTLVEELHQPQRELRTKTMRQVADELTQHIKSQSPLRSTMKLPPQQDYPTIVDAALVQPSLQDESKPRKLVVHAPISLLAGTKFAGIATGLALVFLFAVAIIIMLNKREIVIIANKGGTVTVDVKKDGRIVRELTLLPGEQQLPLWTGDYQFELKGDFDQLKITNGSFTLSKGDKQKITIEPSRPEIGKRRQGVVTQRTLANIHFPKNSETRTLQGGEAAFIVDENDQMYGIKLTEFDETLWVSKLYFDVDFSN